MRRARITFEGAFHHAMNRGHDGKAIFKRDTEKELLLEKLKSCSKQLSMRILAYCIMDNHYHIVLQNSSGRMSDFFKQMNGRFGSIYRKTLGGRGYVFQDRFKSMLIQDETYLLLAIAYVLNNPVRAGLVKNAYGYKWSTYSLYFNQGMDSNIIDNQFVEDLFENQANLKYLMETTILEELPVTKTRVGKIIGGGELFFQGIEKFNRRSGRESMERKRIDDKHFEPVDKIFYELRNKHHIEVEDIDTTTYSGKRIRGELLLNLRDKGGLKYSDIIKMDLFGDLKMHSLGQLYKRTKKRLREK